MLNMMKSFRTCTKATDVSAPMSETPYFDDTSLSPDTQTPAIRVLAMPANTNAAGDIFGGWLMSQVDIAGSMVARRYAGGRVVTVAVNNFEFIQPVFVGDLISIYARLVRVGNTSLQIRALAFAQRDYNEEEYIKVASSDLTYVAIDENRRPRPLQLRSDNRL